MHTYNSLLRVLCCMRDFQYGGMNSHNSAMSSPYFSPNKICKSEIWNWASITIILSLSFNESFSERISKSVKKGRMESLLPAPWELDTTLTPSVRARNLEIISQAAHIKFINGALQQHKTAPASDTSEYKRYYVGMKNTNREVAVHCMFVFPTLNSQNKQKGGLNQNMNYWRGEWCWYNWTWHCSQNHTETNAHAIICLTHKYAQTHTRTVSLLKP